MLLLLFAVAPFVPESLPEGAIARLGSARWRLRSDALTLTYSPDGRRLVVSGGPRLEALDGRTGEPLGTYDGPRADHPFRAAVSPDGRAVAVVVRGRLEVRDAATGAVTRSFDGEFGDLHAGVTFSSDGVELVAVRDVTTLRRWDAKTGTPRPSLKVSDYRVGAVAADPTRRDVAAVALDGSVSVYDLHTSAVRWRTVGHERYYRFRASAAYLPDGRLVSGLGGTVRVWSADGTAGKVLALGEPTVVSVAATRGRVAAGFLDGTVRVYDPDTGRERRRWEAGFRPDALAFSPSGDTLAGGGPRDMRVERWDPDTGRAILPTDGHAAPVTSLCFTSAARLVSLDPSGRRLAWDVPARTHTAVAFPLGVDGAFAATLSADGRLAAFAHPAAVYDAATGRALPQPADVGRRSTAFGPGVRAAAVGGDGRLRVWDAATGKTRTLGPPGEPLGKEGGWDVRAFSPSGDRVVVARHGAYRLADASTGEVLHELRTRAQMTPAAAFAPGGRAVALSGTVDGGPALLLWDPASRAAPRDWPSEGPVTCVAFSADGRLLAAGATGQSVTVLEAATMRPVRRWRGHRSWPRSVVFSPDGGTLASGSNDSTVLLWAVRGAAASADPGKDWEALGDPEAGFDAACRLSRTPDARRLLAKRLVPRVAVEAKAWAALLDRLDSDDFATREAATAELARHGLGAAGQARASAAADGRLEVRRRLSRALAEWEKTHESLRDRRAVMALEWAGEVPLLKRLAAGAPGAALTEDAKAALWRIGHGRP